MNDSYLLDSLNWIGAAAGPVWILITGLQLISIRLINQSDHPNTKRHRIIIIGLIVLIWTYPFYSLWFQLVPGFIGNWIVLAAAIWAIINVRFSSQKAAWLVVPIVPWLLIANFYCSLLLLDHM